MNELVRKIETILFVAGKPVSVKKLAKVLVVTEAAISAALLELTNKYPAGAGVVLFNSGDEWQLVSNPEERELAEQFIKAEASGDLTRPQLEALTVVAYSGPITKPELEAIRGVNCSLILHNLLIRGLVEEREDSLELLPTYEVTMEYLRHLGVERVTELPDYATLHAHDYITKALAAEPSASVVT
ncbi:MAG: SMC-Scp complex subunit ScpB [Candidatus Magasanikbacteria bacterium]|nr:SMC-Scp complex subunit ScpB [Candidatus Magasanikbacteria bacterium]